MDEMLDEQEEKRKFNYIVKCIPYDLHFKLPNYRVSNISDLVIFDKTVKKKIMGKYLEFWHCKTQISDSVESVAGRIYFQANELGYGQVIEQVWNSSPRVIDEFNSRSDFPYILAFRDSWLRRWNIVTICNPFPQKDIAQMREQFYRSAVRIERMRNEIELFGEFLASLDLPIFCLEYKRVNDDFEIIDWDSSDDMKVLAK